MAIPQLGAFPAPPLLGQDQTTFNTNAFNTLSYMSTWVNEMNAVSSAVDVYYLQINQNVAYVTLYKEATETAKTEALSARDIALSAKESIESYVIPTNATYTYSDIDDQNDNKDLEEFLSFNL